MYAVIRTGGKQYLVSPGEQLKIETTAHKDGKLEFSDIVAVSAEEGKFESDLTGAKVLASVVNEGRGDKILVFKLKRKKQYKKMQGHRQNFVEGQDQRDPRQRQVLQGRSEVSIFRQTVFQVKSTQGPEPAQKRQLKWHIKKV